MLIKLNGNDLTISEVVRVARGREPVALDPGAREAVRKARQFVESLADAQVVAYGVTTGVGRLADVPISQEHSEVLQKNLLRSHACGVGPPLPEDVARAVCLLRANALAKGHSGVREEVIDLLCELLNRGVTPVIPSQGSLGASGDLAPLAHMALVLMGEGVATYRGEVMSGERALREVGLEPLVLQAKEGLALINGTQVMSAIACLLIHDSEQLAASADAIAALTCEGLRGITAAFDPRIHDIRPHPGQMAVAQNLRALLAGSELVTRPGELRVQDAYALRCIPQVHGATRQALTHAREVVTREINSATDNPLLFPDDGDVVSGGNFHGQPIALVMEYLAIAIAELANISERRIERLVNPNLSGLPAFLTAKPGLNSGFMIAQYTAASLVSENKVLAHPAAVDSIPSSANQEDHVSMGTISARKARQILANVWKVLAIELMCAAQAVDFHPPLALGRGTRLVYEFARQRCPHLDEDRLLADDIERLASALSQGQLAERARGTCA